MQIYFRDIIAPKKEARKLRQYITHLLDSTPNRQWFNDCIAQMYGWSSWNALYCAHRDVNSDNIDRLVFINDLDGTDMATLYDHKLSVLATRIQTLGINPSATEAILDTLLSRPYHQAVRKNAPPINDDNTTVMSQWPNSVWNRHMLFVGPGSEKRDATLSYAVERMAKEDGGVAFLSHRETELVLSSLSGSVQGTSSVCVISADEQTIPNATHHLAPQWTESDTMIEAYLMGLIERCGEKMDPAGMWASRYKMLWEGILCYAKAKYGSVRAAYQQGFADIEGDLDAMVACCLDETVKQKHRHRLADTILNLPGYNPKITIQPATSHEKLQYITMLSGNVRDIDTHPSSLPKLEFGQELAAGKTILVVLPDTLCDKVRNRCSGVLAMIMRYARQSREDFLLSAKKRICGKTLLMNNDILPLWSATFSSLRRSSGWGILSLVNPDIPRPVFDKAQAADFIARIDFTIIAPSALPGSQVPDDARHRLGRGEVIVDGEWLPASATPPTLRIT